MFKINKNVVKSCAEVNFKNFNNIFKTLKC